MSLADGTEPLVRPAGPGDWRAALAMHERCTPASLPLPYHGPLRHPCPPLHHPLPARPGRSPAVPAPDPPLLAPRPPLCAAVDAHLPPPPAAARPRPGFP
ncbi:hypothetical protein VM98_36615, partial [Streptomyces rubellomurinus subsp. indigoferus]